MKLLLLPGMDGTGRMFFRFLKALPPNLGPQVVAYPSQLSHSYEGLIGLIPIPQGEFAIVAESFSGPLGITIAADMPGRVRALILVASFARNPSICPAFPGAFIRPWFFRIRYFERVMCKKLMGSGNEELALELSQVLHSVAPDVLAVRSRAILRVKVLGTLPEVRAPILYLRGRKDSVVGLRSLREIQSANPDVQTVELDAHHLVLQERPEEAAECIQKFLTQHSLQ